jgi:hypothetical protein
MDLKNLTENVLKLLSQRRKTIPKICQATNLDELDVVTAIFELELQKKVAHVGWKSLYDGKEQLPLHLAVYGLTPLFRRKLAQQGKL